MNHILHRKFHGIEIPNFVVDAAFDYATMTYKFRTVSNSQITVTEEEFSRGVDWTQKLAEKKLEEKAVPGKKKLRAGSGHTVQPRSTAPKCKACRADMDYDPERRVWVCPTEGCGLIARPKRTNEDAPVIGSGQVTAKLVQTKKGDKKVYLVSDDNVCLDVTAIVENVEWNSAEVTTLGAAHIQQIPASAEVTIVAMLSSTQEPKQ